MTQGLYLFVRAYILCMCVGGQGEGEGGGLEGVLIYINIR
jgi:hypothetical protein